MRLDIALRISQPSTGPAMQISIRYVELDPCPSNLRRLDSDAVTAILQHPCAVYSPA